jgi:hypothetical protein
VLLFDFFLERRRRILVFGNPLEGGFEENVVAFHPLLCKIGLNLALKNVDNLHFFRVGFDGNERKVRDGRLREVDVFQGRSLLYHSLNRFVCDLLQA